MFKSIYDLDSLIPSYMVKQHILKHMPLSIKLRYYEALEEGKETELFCSSSTEQTETYNLKVGDKIWKWEHKI